MRFDRLASANLLRMRVTSQHYEITQSIALAAVVGAALMLLLVGGTYNASFFVVARKQFTAWQAAWAFCMLAWGACWSQLILLIFPRLAGAALAQASTALAFFAIMFAALSAISAIERQHLSAKLRVGSLGFAIAAGVMGIPLAMARSGPFDFFVSLSNFLAICVLLAIALCLTQAWKRGSKEARSLVKAWSVPMIALGAIRFIDSKDAFGGNGAQLCVLLSAAWQTLWLSISTSRGYSQLRNQRDMARRAEAQAHDLARRDLLTGLRNRRGFFEMFDAYVTAPGAVPVALLIIDVDHFKSINDIYGHTAGDTVLENIAQQIAKFEGERCVSGRIGGEEFAVLVSGIEGQALRSFAEKICRAIEICDHSAVINTRRVTVSIGIAEMQLLILASTDTVNEAMEVLYHKADVALYAAKREGRNRVILNDDDKGETLSQLL